MAPRKYKLGKRAAAVEETRRRIVDATFQLHSEKGVRATSMQDVAERADVALRTVYNHYPKVEDLVAGCGEKVMLLLSPPTPEIFSGIERLVDRMRLLVHELFAMYERGSVQIATSRWEQGEIPALARFVANEAAIRTVLALEALRPFEPHSRTVNEVAALTDFYVWKAFTQQGLTTHQAEETVYRVLVALAEPELAG